MKNFLFEIFSEEIPATLQKQAAQNLLKISEEILLKNGLHDIKAETFVMPNRLVLSLKDLSQSQITPAFTKFGPKITQVTQDKKPLQGFMRSVGVENEEELEVLDGVYTFKRPESKIDTIEILQKSLPQIMQKMLATWPKVMRWDIKGNQQPKWIRPIRNLLAIFEDKVVELDFYGIGSNSSTMIRENPITKSYKLSLEQEYWDLLQSKNLVIDHQERKKMITNKVNELCKTLNLASIVSINSSLFDEIAGLCDNPDLLVANIDQSFLTLPDEVLILTLQSNQRYICLKNEEGKLSDKFIFATNQPIQKQHQAMVIADNEKLVRARLNDAQFFIEEDLKKPLESRLEALKKVIFHQKLGSVFQKIERMTELAKFIALFIPHSEINLIERATNLCKADLTTKAVAELPELQGKIGGFYAHQQQENPRIVTAIYEHYLPIGLDSQLPETPLGISLAIADKMDSITGFFLVDEKPTSSKDPYALRRCALGIIRIILKQQAAISLRLLVEKSLHTYPPKIKSSNSKQSTLIEEIIIFFLERLRAHLKDSENIRTDIVNSVIDNYVENIAIHHQIDICFLSDRIRFISLMLSNQENQGLILLYKRSINILSIEEKKDKKRYDDEPSPLYLAIKEERKLYEALKEISPRFKLLALEAKFHQAILLLQELVLPLNEFFEHVMVNDPLPELRKNRLLLLGKIRDLFNEIGDFSKIEIN